jgi:hypothetical protein
VGSNEQRRICDVALPCSAWAGDHRRRIEAAYRDAPYFDAYRSLLDGIYAAHRWRTLSELNQHTIREIAALLGIRATFRDSREFELQSRKQDRILELLRFAGADVYVTGPSAKSYIEAQRFADAGVELAWKNYDGYPPYVQLHGPFAPDVTILDLLFHTGPDAPHYIWGWRSAAP